MAKRATTRELLRANLKASHGMEFRPIGAFGVSACVEANELLIRIPINESLEQGQPSTSGKNVLVANTGGWVPVPDTDPAMRINVMAMVPPHGRLG